MIIFKILIIFQKKNEIFIKIISVCLTGRSVMVEMIWTYACQNLYRINTFRIIKKLITKNKLALKAQFNSKKEKIKQIRQIALGYSLRKKGRLLTLYTAMGPKWLIHFQLQIVLKFIFVKNLPKICNPHKFYVLSCYVVENLIK